MNAEDGQGINLWDRIRRFIRNRFRVYYDCLGWRLVIVLTGALLILLGSSSWFALKLHRQHLYSLLEQNAVDLGETILLSTHLFMLQNDQENLAQVIEDIGERESVLTLRLVNALGEVRHSSSPQDIGLVSDMASPACQGCHAEGHPVAPESLREGLRLYQLPNGGEALGLVVPVLNSPECADAACHVHPADQAVLGMMDLELSTTSLTSAMSAARAQMAGLALLTVVLVTGLIGVLSWRVVHRPIHSVLDGIRRIGAGDLSYRVTPLPSGELGELGSSINRMSGQLDRARRELQEWNEGLEDKVEEKTLELEKTRDQMVFTEKMASLGKLSAIVAHEINNPLAGILVYVKLLRRRLPKLPNADEAQAEIAKLDETLATVELETARCGDIVRNLLLFSRRRETQQAPADINLVLERAIKLVQHQADLNCITTSMDLGRDLPEVVCDAAEIEQAVLALIMNAMEAMPDGGAMELRTRFLPGPQTVVIEIADTGPGIPPELQSRIFEPFFSTKTEGNATGLGLAVTYGIIQRHQGQIEIDSPPGKGTTFRFRIPIEPRLAGTLEPTVDSKSLPKEVVS